MPLWSRQEKLLRPPWHCNSCLDPGAWPVATPGMDSGKNSVAWGQQCSRLAPRAKLRPRTSPRNSCVLGRGGGGSCFFGEGRERAWSWAAAPGTVPSRISQLPGTGKTPSARRFVQPLQLWVLCAAPSTSADPMHPTPAPLGTAPLAPRGPRCPESCLQDRPGTRPIPGESPRRPTTPRSCRRPV